MITIHFTTFHLPYFDSYISRKPLFSNDEKLSKLEPICVDLAKEHYTDIHLGEQIGIHPTEGARQAEDAMPAVALEENGAPQKQVLRS